MDVLFELADGLGREGVRHNLALASVFGAVAGVEEAALDGNKGVVVFTVRDVSGEKGKDGGPLFDSPLQKPISMAVDGVDEGVVCYGDVIRLDSNHLAVFLV